MLCQKKSHCVRHAWLYKWKKTLHSIGTLTVLSMEAIKFVIAFYTVQFINRNTKCWRTHTHIYTLVCVGGHWNPHICAQTCAHRLKLRAIKSLLEPVLSDFPLSKGCKMEIRLSGWHSFSLPAACIIESHSNTFKCDSDSLILARCSSPLTFY